MPGWNYTDFEIELRADGTIDAHGATVGDAQAKFHLKQDAIALALELVNAEPGGQTNAGLLKSFGEQLYHALIPPPIDARLQSALAIARVTAAGDARRGVRIRLVIENPAWAALPWELLYDPAAGAFLAQSPETALSRYIDAPLPTGEQQPPTRPLRLLLAAAAPRGRAPFEPAREFAPILTALEPKILAGNLIVDPVEHLSARTLRHLLRAHDYAIIHLIAHGDFHDERGWIILEDDMGDAVPIDDEAFSAFFLGERRINLAVLSACEGGNQATSDIFAGLAPQLVRRGLPAVVAMRYPVALETMRLFSDEFYHALSQGWPIDAAIQAARAAIAQDIGFDRRDFATPALFTRARDGMLFGSTE